MSKNKNAGAAASAPVEKKVRKARTSREGKETNISKATTMLMNGTTMKDIEKATGDTSYAAIRKLEAQGYTFDKSKRDAEGRIFYHAVAPKAHKKEVRKAA